MSALGHYLEEEGLATTQISLIRPHTEKIRPPRALWVPFELGRPFGPPDQPDFQRRVILAALGLLERKQGPVLEDFPEDAPEDAAPDDGSGWVCPVALGAPPSAGAEPGSLAEALAMEIHQLRPWYDSGRDSRGGRTAVGLSRIGIDAIGPFVAGFLGDRWPDNPRDDIALGNTLKFAVEDLKSFYLEAANAKPGARGGSIALEDWLWRETAFGRVMRALQPVAAASDDPSMKAFGERTLIPQRMKGG